MSSPSRPMRRALRSAPAASTARPNATHNRRFADVAPATNSSLRPSVVFSTAKLYVTVNGAAAFYTATLSSMPESDVTISPSNVATSLRVTPTLHVFTKLNWYTPQSFRVAAVTGAMAVDDHTLPTSSIQIQTLEHTSHSLDPRFHGDRLLCLPNTIAVHVSPRDGVCVFASGRVVGTAWQFGKGTTTATCHAFGQLELDALVGPRHVRTNDTASRTPRGSIVVHRMSLVQTASGRRSLVSDPTTTETTETSTLVASSVVDTASFVRVACRQHQTLLLQRNGSIITLGKRSSVAEPSTLIDDDAVGDAALSKMLIDVACGDDHIVALTEHGYVLTWGDGRDGRLGLGNDISRPTPTLVRTLLHKRIVQIACGARHALVLAEDGDVFAWGYGRSGALGLATSPHSKAPVESVTTPMEVLTLKHRNVAMLSCGDLHSAVVLMTGALLTCGWAIHGRLGRTVTAGQESSNCFMPVDIGTARCTYVACGGAHTLALTDDHGVLAFGANHSGQLGVGDGRDRGVPTLIAYFDLDSLVVTSIAAGKNHSLATTHDGRVFAWGSDEFGQCGVGAGPQLYTAPHLVASAIGLGITQVACGDGHSALLGRASQRHLDVLEANHPVRYAQLLDLYERFVEEDKTRRTQVLLTAKQRRQAHEVTARQRPPPFDPMVPRGPRWQAQLQDANMAARDLVANAHPVNPQTRSRRPQTATAVLTTALTKEKIRAPRPSTGRVTTQSRVRCSSAALWRQARLFTFDTPKETQVVSPVGRPPIRPGSSQLRLTTEGRQTLGRIFHGDVDSSRVPSQVYDGHNTSQDSETKADQLRVAAQFSATRPKSAPSRAAIETTRAS